MDKLVKTASEQDARIEQLKEQMEEAEAARAKTAAELMEAKEDVSKVAQEMSSACGSDTKAPAGASPMEEDSKLEEAWNQVRVLKHQAAVKAVGHARWLVTAGLQEDCEQEILEEVLQDFPDTVPDLEAEVARRLQKPVTEKEKVAKEEIMKEQEESGRGRSRSPPRDKMLRQLVLNEHKELKAQLMVLRSTKDL